MAMTTPTRSRVTYRNEPEWTPRQREVLDLLVRNHTNSQIAETLGISLDGAKWHVSEIITKLGVETRDEAAEYWRARNGLQMRFTRVLQGLFSGTGLKVTAGVAAAGAVGIATVFALVVILNRAEGEDNGIVSPPPPANTDPGANPTSAPNTTTPPALTGEVVDGVAVKTLTIGAPVTLPKDLVVYYRPATYATDGGDTRLYRAYTDASGVLRSDPLFTGDLEGAFSYALDTGRGTIGVSVCVQGYCGGVAEPSPDARAVGYLSTDGGVSFVRLGELTRGAFVNGVVGGELLVTRYGDGSATHSLFPSGKTVNPPVTLASPVQVAGGILWQTPEGAILDSAGQSLSPAQTYGMTTASRPIVSSGESVKTWAKQPTAAQSLGRQYLGVFQGTKLAAAYSWQGNDLRAVVRLSGTQLLGNFAPQQTGFGEFPAMLVDLGAGLIYPVPELSELLRAEGHIGQPFIQAASPGAVARVTNAGDCLNVRESASTAAKTLGCYKDGVLLKDRATTEQAGGITWWAVATPDGREGWASSEFLRR